MFAFDIIRLLSSAAVPTLATKLSACRFEGTLIKILSSTISEIITVANYVNLNSYYDVTNTLQTTTETTGELSASSSAGPTRTNATHKPDIAASGASIFSTIVLSMQANLIANAPAAVDQGSFHVIGGGTSASSPVVAGLAALFLEAFPNSTNQQVKQAI